MKALSIMQPWAWLIVNGHKDIENRRWSTKYRGPVLIHAGKREDDDFDPRDFPSIEHLAKAPWTGDVHAQTGGIVGEAEIVDCVTASESPWFFGRFGFLIRNARPLPFQPCRGMLGFFEPNFDPYEPRYKAPPRQGQLL